MKTNFKKSPSAHECHFYGKKQSQNQNLEKKNLPWPMSAKSDTLSPDFINVKKNDIFCKSTITLTYSSFLKSINFRRQDFFIIGNFRIFRRQDFIIGNFRILPTAQVA